ncbi:MAG TPA: cyclic nucleotide-binding domain-containing protein [Acidimicrobiales bacterium]|nr:cyclic nucleotide-binding domain-containing protein [Acidimicrobiales bacterium]
MALRSSAVDKLRQIPMFSQCSKRELSVLGRLVEEVDIGEGRALTREGAAGSEFFIILSGQAAVTRRGRRITVLGPGDSFGELALLNPAPRDATVTAVTPMRVAVLGRREFSGALAGVPSIAQKVMVGMAQRLQELDQGNLGRKRTPAPGTS